MSLVVNPGIVQNSIGCNSYDRRHLFFDKGYLVAIGVIGREARVYAKDRATSISSWLGIQELIVGPSWNVR